RFRPKSSGTGGPLPLGAAGARGLRPEPRAGKLTWASATRCAPRSRSAPPPMDRPVVLVTGMSGRIGGAVRRRVGAGAEVRALNRRAVDGVPTHRADIADLDAIQPAFRGVAAVVHLTAR